MLIKKVVRRNIVELGNFFLFIFLKKKKSVLLGYLNCDSKCLLYIICWDKLLFFFWNVNEGSFNFCKFYLKLLIIIGIW